MKWLLCNLQKGRGHEHQRQRNRSTVKYIIEMGQLDEKCDIGDSLVVQWLRLWAFIAEATVQSLDGELSALLD